MGLDFGKTKASSAPTTETEFKQYDIIEDRNKMTAELTGSQEVDDIVSSITIDDINTIATFGAEIAEKVSKASDVVLDSASMSKLDDASEMLDALAKIMDKFDPKEIQEPSGFFNKLFGGMKKQLDKLLSKYHAMGDEIDKIYVGLKAYETEIRQSNQKLNQMFDENVNFYHQLVKYILAGEQACAEIRDYIEQRRQDMEASGDQSIQFELASLSQALTLMEQRTQDLRTAESVALQSAPMIKTMEFSNYNLIRKINSAFIITLPVFKQALAQAVLLKRQKLQAEAMSELDKKTNEMLIKNAVNAAEVSKITARLASGNSIQAETLETTWRAITNGIEETKRIQEEANQKRIADKAKLEEIKEQFNRQYHMPPPKN